MHILVATPGRLCELITDEEIPMFRDMSGIRFLIVDEADRIVEEGHFPEVRERQRKKERERAREGVCVCVCVCV